MDSKPQIDYVKAAEAVYDELKAAHNKEVIYIKAEKVDDLSLEESKFGGFPFVPLGGAIPTNAEGSQLALLAQINCAQLPENNMYPSDGWLQVWCLEDEMYGFCSDTIQPETNQKVLYIPAGTQGEPLERVVAMYQPYTNEECPLWFVDEQGDIWGMRLSFTHGQQGITYSDGRFRDLFLDRWNKRYPEQAVENFYDLPDEIFENMVDSHDGPDCAHQLGGYPYFTQYDPRYEYDSAELAKYTEVLFQIDSQFDTKWDLCWGDAGVRNLFISREDLEALDFSDLLYNFDCC
ncbi:MAG: DUF1963 domain-containing protein [Actinomyces graevenitzii]|jgi:conserved hypothetical protein|uniref:YwqG family protein n=1 Tax=Actinomyces graevenitzii TaxID=55565 RepID=UPI000C80271F|nr:YwqG family protein [Actinomyces graevenitzii]MBS6933942.1 DUF1963 domain-containing protein [Actinomyces graevenitzii]PMC92107.1 DUF1963 domain-containing protein [Actinomyces graevenitzii]